MKCKFCGKEIDEGSHFCGFCGKEQPKVKCCIKCGHEIELEDKWCGYCGASQTAEKNLVENKMEKQPLSPKIKDQVPTVLDSTCEQRQNNQEDSIEKISKTDSSSDKEVLSKNSLTFNISDDVHHEKKSSKIKYVIIVLVILLLLCVFFFGYLLYGNVNKDLATPSQDSCLVDSTYVDNDSVMSEDIEENEFNCDSLAGIWSQSGGGNGSEIFHIFNPDGTGYELHICYPSYDDADEGAEREHKRLYNFNWKIKGNQIIVKVTETFSDDFNVGDKITYFIDEEGPYDDWGDDLIFRFYRSTEDEIN